MFSDFVAGTFCRLRCFVLVAWDVLKLGYLGPFAEGTFCSLESYISCGALDLGCVKILTFFNMGCFRMFCTWNSLNPFTTTRYYYSAETF
jgi:hypothetical protein